MSTRDTAEKFEWKLSAWGGLLSGSVVDIWGFGNKWKEEPTLENKKDGWLKEKLGLGWIGVKGDPIIAGMLLTEVLVAASVWGVLLESIYVNLDNKSK